MATTILILLVALLVITVLPFIVKRRHTELHRTDLMAGDEGEDDANPGIFRKV